ncbi:UNVERIFIED_ORG: hypothetical protein ABIC97_003714 [Peribacillus simplex]
MITNENKKHVAIYLRLSKDEENRGIEKNPRLPQKFINGTFL